MSRVIADISMSLDGYVTGPDAGPELGLGRGGEPIHAWVWSDDPIDRSILEEATDASGAVVMGRHLFDVIDGPGGWNDEVGYGADQVGRPPFFVVTSSQPTSVRLATTHDFTFVLDGPAMAVSQAREAAADKDVVIMGGGEVIRGSIDAGVADELRIHLSPVILGAGTRLFEGGSPRQLVQREVKVSTYATHLIYDVV